MLLDVLIGVIAVVLVIGLFVLARLATRVGRAADDVGRAARRVAEIAPAAHTFIEAGHAELEALRSLTNTMGTIAENARKVSGHASAVTSELLRGVESEIFHRYRAVFAGLRAGATVLGMFRSRNGSGASSSAKVEEFDDMQG
jgi:hypothetical protein